MDNGHSSPLKYSRECTIFTGGYTLRNVARCWCFETSRMLGLDLPDQLPDSVSLLLLLLLLLLFHKLIAISCVLGLDLSDQLQ